MKDKGGKRLIYKKGKIGILLRKKKKIVLVMDIFFTPVKKSSIPEYQLNFLNLPLEALERIISYLDDMGKVHFATLNKGMLNHFLFSKEPIFISLKDFYQRRTIQSIFKHIFCLYKDIIKEKKYYVFKGEDSSKLCLVTKQIRSFIMNAEYLTHLQLYSVQLDPFTKLVNFLPSNVPNLKEIKAESFISVFIIFYKLFEKKAPSCTLKAPRITMMLSDGNKFDWKSSDQKFNVEILKEKTDILNG
jgi:hypothetical protein